jgi:hypothetical protein
MALTYQQAVVEIADRANKRTFTDAAVQSLALTFKKVNIKTAIAPSVVGGKVEPYAVLGEDNVGKPRVVFQPTAPNGKPLPSVFIVPTVAATDMDQVEVTDMLKKIKVPAFKATTNPPTKNTWKLLDLDVSPPQVVISSQLSGCTFVVGTVGRKFYMGHTQPPPSVTGEDYVKSLRKGPVFNGLPKPESMLFVQPGSKNDTNTVAYASTRYANLLGFVVGQKVQFIVAIVVKETFAVEKVFVVTQASSSKWDIKQV